MALSWFLWVQLSGPEKSASRLLHWSPAFSLLWLSRFEPACNSLFCSLAFSLTLHSMHSQCSFWSQNKSVVMQGIQEKPLKFVSNFKGQFCDSLLSVLPTHITVASLSIFHEFLTSAFHLSNFSPSLIPPLLSMGLKLQGTLSEDGGPFSPCGGLDRRIWGCLESDCEAGY